ncbi:MAG: DUF92 domain-containing protein [Chlorobium sp.]|jgi:uncharacterized protein (TIGR00297 family)|nr:DUF92 domain-containing protein [Chlorobium sp.]
MLNLQAPLPQDFPAFFLTLCLILLFVLLAELLTKKFSISGLVVRKVVHLSMGVVIFFVPAYFHSNFYPALAALLFLLFNGLNIRFKWFGSLLALPEEKSAPSPAVKSYGSLLFPLVFLLQLLFLWESHKWILQTSMLVMGVSDSLAALVGSSVGKKHIEHLTKSPKTVEGSLTMFISSFLLLSASLMVFSKDFSGGLAGKPVLLLLALALLLALVATAVEALLSHGLDNFFIPVSIAYILYLLEINHAIVEQFLLGGLFAFLLAVFSIKVKFLDNSGAVATFLLGTTIFGIGGVEWTVPLLTFYLLSSVLSKLGKKRKAKFDLVFEKGSQRDAGQVYANGGIAWIMMIIFSLTNDPAIFFAYLGTLAAVQADTWATEIGTMWPNPKAWLVTTFKEVPVGTSGGVSVPGTSGAFLGSLFICASALAVNVKWMSEFGVLQSFLLIGFSGLLASLVDSFFGATVQAQYFDPIREKVTERTHSLSPDGVLVENRLLKGTPLVNNDLVNTLCALSGSALAYTVIESVNLF